MRSCDFACCLFVVLLAACASPVRSGGASNEAPQRGPRELVPALPDVEKCSGVPLVSIADLPTHDAQRVAIDGVPTVLGACTLLACVDWKNEPAACCNRCGGAYALRGDGVDVLLEDAGTCGGMDCDFHCEPFGTNPTRAYRFVGYLDTKLAPQQAVLIVDTICSLDG